MQFQHCTALDSSCCLIQEWSMPTSFTWICRDGLTNHFAMNIDAVCISLFYTVELIVMSLDLLYTSQSLMGLNAIMFVFLKQKFYFNCQKILWLHFSELLTPVGSSFWSTHHFHLPFLFKVSSCGSSVLNTSWVQEHWGVSNNCNS